MNTRPTDHSKFRAFQVNADTYLEILFPHSGVHRFTSYTSFLLICSDCKQVKSQDSSEQELQQDNFFFTMVTHVLHAHRLQVLHLNHGTC